MKGFSISRHILSILLVAAMFTLFDCSTNPVTGKKELMLVSEKQEMAMGAQADPSIVASFGLYQNQELQKFIEVKGKEMARISHRPDLPYEFKILDSPVVNAFAVPGGYVYFTRGILAHFNNEAEFAGVLGHEIGHITARHSAKQQSKSMLAQVGLIAGVIASPTFRQFADVANQSLGLLFLKFGRDAESQSDRLGVEYSTKIGYDAHQMAGFFATLDRMRSSSGAEPIPNFLSTHPDPADREQNVHKLATEWQRQANLTDPAVKRNEYLNMINGLVYGEDPNQGYVYNNNFYHPSLKFQFPVPQGWQFMNSPQQVQMAPRDGKAALLFSLAQGQSASAAAQKFVQDSKLKVINNQQGNINGLPAVDIIGDAQNQQDPNNPLRVQATFIEYNNLVYQFLGLSTTRDFASYQRTFGATVSNFARLTDNRMIDVTPDRIKVVKVNRAQTLQQALSDNRVPSKQMEETAILNSMMLTDKLPAGTMIKVIDLGRRPGR